MYNKLGREAHVYFTINQGPSVGLNKVYLMAFHTGDEDESEDEMGSTPRYNRGIGGSKINAINLFTTMKT
jgi:hypothetical protein